jgi:hypothetical protein
VTKQFCDFCGDEMEAKDKRATLTIHNRAQEPRVSAGYFMLSFAGEPRESGTTMEMCAACLGHLLPVTQRITTEREVARSAKKHPKDGVIAKELRGHEAVTSVRGKGVN